jgi:L-alanine-DL-glutamate epimerase-like enolase superfamily enzyme
MSTYAKLAHLPLTVESYELEGLKREVSSGFERLTTVIHLRGGGEEGIGEDVVYDAEDHLVLQEAGPIQPLAGTFTLDEFCRKIDQLDLFPVEPSHGEVSRLYRRWAFHSAALDLALRQRGAALHHVLGREARPVTFVVSLRLGEPATIEPLLRRLERYPTLRFKLDPTDSWTPELVAQLVETGAVDSVDFKSFYSGTVVDVKTDPELYRLVAESFPDAWLEDPDLNEETEPILRPHHARITWDAPIHGIDDIESRPFAPKMVNVKPSRLGGLQKLCDAYDYLADHGMRAYGGGQFELGPGRGQAQYLASLFHPDTPNDLAPVGYNQNDPPEGLSASPLPVAAAPVGFRWG